VQTAPAFAEAKPIPCITSAGGQVVGKGYAKNAFASCQFFANPANLIKLNVI
jgi:hypothetical protein